MGTGDPVNCVDGKTGISVGSWAEDKLFFVRRYCYMVNSGMKNFWKTRTYIDLFCGPGMGVIEDTKVEILGSPMVATASPALFTHCYFNDTNENYIQALQQRVLDSNPDSIIKYYRLDCNKAVAAIKNDLPQNSLDFCFVDPLNWEIEFASIEFLTANRKMDLLTTFHFGSMKRLPSDTEKLLNFFPPSEEAKRYLKENVMCYSQRKLLDLYEDGLRRLGYNYFRDTITESNSRNVQLYTLLYATKHPRGADFWDKAAARRSSGQTIMNFQL